MYSTCNMISFRYVGQMSLTTHRDQARVGGFLED